MPPRRKKISIREDVPRTENTIVMPTRVEEWNGLTKGDRCRVTGGYKGAAYTFLGLVTQPNGKQYIDVLEQKEPNRSSMGSRLQRCIAPIDRVRPMPKKRVKKTAT